MTYELLVHYLDDAVDRRRNRIETMVEAVRLGTVFSTNIKAYQKWRQRVTPVTSLSDGALEAAIGRLGQQFPGQVIRGTMPA